jgi:hypothetical protein
MNAQEVKLKLITSVNRLIDTYFGGMAITEKMINATLKVLVKQNAYKIDGMLGLFADQNGNINPQEILMEYANQIDDNGIVIDIKQYINNDTLKQFIPNKVLIIKKEDVLSLIV